MQGSGESEREGGESICAWLKRASIFSRVGG